MATGRYVSDLDTGDILGPVHYRISPFTVREYCHAVEIGDEMFQGAGAALAPPTLVHLDKLKLYEAACPAGTGPDARLHVEFDATWHAPLTVGTEVAALGRVTGRHMKRGRTYVVTEILLSRVADGAPLVTYRDTVILAWRKSEEPQ